VLGMEKPGPGPPLKKTSTKGQDQQQSGRGPQRGTPGHSGHVERMAGKGTPGPGALAGQHRTGTGAGKQMSLSFFNGRTRLTGKTKAGTGAAMSRNRVRGLRRVPCGPRARARGGLAVCYVVSRRLTDGQVPCAEGGARRASNRTLKGQLRRLRPPIPEKPAGGVPLDMTPGLDSGARHRTGGGAENIARSVRSGGRAGIHGGNLLLAHVPLTKFPGAAGTSRETETRARGRLPGAVGGDCGRKNLRRNITPPGRASRSRVGAGPTVPGSPRPGPRSGRPMTRSRRVGVHRP